MSKPAGQSSVIEAHSFDFVPLDERHGRPRNLFFLWFGENAQIFAVVTGVIGIVLGLSLWWTVVAILIGNLLGALFMAFHSAQGPQLGLPQMIQSRAQFGYHGALLPLLLVWVMYIAFAAVDIVLAGQGFQAVLPWSLDGWMVVLTVPMVALAVFGYDWIHAFLKYATWLYVAVFLGLTIAVVVHGVPAAAVHHGSFQLGHFILSISIFAA